MLLNLPDSWAAATKFNLDRPLDDHETCLAGQARCGEYNPDSGLATKRRTNEARKALKQLTEIVVRYEPLHNSSDTYTGMYWLNPCTLASTHVGRNTTSASS